MLNHFRTLLLNIAGPPVGGLYPRNLAGGVPDDEAIPPGFVPIVLPQSLLTARRVLFGRTPDNAMLAYRARQLLTLVHATELMEFVYALDPRVSYDTGSGGGAPLLSDIAFSPIVTQVSGDTAQLSVVGTPAAPDVLGILGYSFAVTVSDDLVTVTPVGSDAISYVRSDSAAWPLRATGYMASVPSSVTNGAWTVTGYVRPLRSLGTVAADLDATSVAIPAFLFGAGSAEPYQTWRNLWQNEGTLAYRLGALTCALVYRTQEAAGGVSGSA